MAEYVSHLGSQSQRPKGLLCTFSAAFSSLQEALDIWRPLSSDVRKLMQGVQKENTFLPLQRSRIMPIAPFIGLFKSWSTSLRVEELRLKTLTLFALTTMLRPSDIAPQSGRVFCRSAITSDEEGGLIVYFHGTKNDADQDGFRVHLRPSSDPEVCPVKSLLQYLTRTVVQAKGCGGPVFVSLQPPYSPLSATTIANILNQAITMAGLDRSLYSAKNFRLTGATVAVQTGAEPAQVQALGCWKQPDTFLKHYVHSAPDVNITNKILGISEISQKESTCGNGLLSK